MLCGQPRTKSYKHKNARLIHWSNTKGKEMSGWTPWRGIVSYNMEQRLSLVPTLFATVVITRDHIFCVHPRRNSQQSQNALVKESWVRTSTYYVRPFRACLVFASVSWLSISKGFPTVPKCVGQRVLSPYARTFRACLVFASVSWLKTSSIIFARNLRSTSHSPLLHLTQRKNVTEIHLLGGMPWAIPD